MKKIDYFILVAIEILIVPPYIIAQESWHVQNPLPTESYLLTVEPVIDNKIFIG